MTSLSFVRNSMFLSSLVLGLAIAMPTQARAAELYLVAPAAAVPGEEVLVHLRMHIGNDLINALSGNISIDGASSEISRINDGHSSLVLWVDRPALDSNKHKLSFSGITPGGLSGDVEVLAFVLKADASGSIGIHISDTHALRNDGQGTEAPIRWGDTSISIFGERSTKKISFDDTVAPESFALQLGKENTISQSNYVITFATEDKGTGIDHYEYAGSWWGIIPSGWQHTESPIVLSKLMYGERIYVKALDRAGNERISSIDGPWRAYSLIAGGILMVLILCLVPFALWLRFRSVYS